MEREDLPWEYKGSQQSHGGDHGTVKVYPVGVDANRGAGSQVVRRGKHQEHYSA